MWLKEAGSSMMVPAGGCCHGSTSHAWCAVSKNAMVVKSQNSLLFSQSHVADMAIHTKRFHLSIADSKSALCQARNTGTGLSSHPVGVMQPLLPLELLLPQALLLALLPLLPLALLLPPLLLLLPPLLLFLPAARCCWCYCRCCRRHRHEVLTISLIRLRPLAQSSSCSGQSAPTSPSAIMALTSDRPALGSPPAGVDSTAAASQHGGYMICQPL